MHYIKAYVYFIVWSHIGILWGIILNVQVLFNKKKMHTDQLIKRYGLDE